MTVSRILPFVILTVATCAPEAFGSPARFWISSSNIDPVGPEAPAIAGVARAIRYLHIWAQPETVNTSAAYNVNTNRFRTLRNISLNVVSDPDGSGTTSVSPIIDFLDGTYTIYNPVLDGNRRYEFVSDSHQLTGDISPPLTSDWNEGMVLAGNSDAIKSLQGFTIGSTGYAGLGHSLNHNTVGCHPADPYCALTDDGSPAWLLASVAFRTLAPTGSAPVYLQIGANGMTYQLPATPTQPTGFAFGTNSAGVGPVYDAQIVGDRMRTSPADNADVSVTAVAPTAVQLSTWTAATGQWTDNSWSAGVSPSFVTNARLPNALGTNVVTVHGKQQANLTNVDGARLKLAADGALASEVVVGPAGAIAGPGWVGSNLTIAAGGKLTIDSLQPLQVVGSANIGGAMLAIGSGFSSSGSATVEILRATGGIIGQLNVTNGQSLGNGVTLQSVTYNGNSIFAMLSSAVLDGDFNGDLSVDAADYVAWRNGLGTTFQQSHYDLWRANFGRTSAAAAIAGNSIPEPATIAMALAAGAVMVLALPRAIATRGNEPYRWAIGCQLSARCSRLSLAAQGSIIGSCWR